LIHDNKGALSLEKSVECGKDVRVIGSNSVMKKCKVTLLVMSAFFV